MRRTLEAMYEDRKKMFIQKATTARTENVRWSAGSRGASSAGTPSTEQDPFILVVNTYNDLPVGGAGAILVNNPDGYPIDSKIIVIDSLSGALSNGDVLIITGEPVLQRVTAHVESGGNTVQVTITPGLTVNIADNTSITLQTGPKLALVNDTHDLFARVNFTGTRGTDWQCLTRLYT